MIKATLEKVINEDMAEIWQILKPDERRAVAENLQIHNFKKNQLIYAEGEQPEYLWVLLKGKVKKTKEGVGGRVQIIRLIRPVQYFGYRAFFAEEPYVSSALAFEPSTLGAIPLTLVKSLIDQNIQLAWFFIHELSHNLGGSDTRIVNLTQKHIRGRLAEALIVLLDNNGSRRSFSSTAAASKSSTSPNCAKSRNSDKPLRFKKICTHSPTRLCVIFYITPSRRAFS